MKMHFRIAFIALTFLFSIASTFDCDIIPEDIVKPKNTNDVDRYVIVIQGNPKTYTPNQKYNVSLRVNPNKNPRKAFKQFFLTLESVDEDSAVKSYRPTGQFDFEVGEPTLTQFSETCPNTVVQNSKLPKWEIQVYWIAPPENSGCVAIKATVVESRENWFSEDGQLTKILCEDSEVDENVKPPLVDKCCACSEAKYEIAFEGRWTRNTHPRNYPPDLWSTKFSDIIGASHRKFHSFWNEQDYASEGLKELAESGRTQSVEAEIKEMGTNIRTIIKARGLQHPNITESSYAVFRVDPNNHLVSLASKITPSPDWFVGVANFELCKSDCTWAESYTYNLYPLDAGTDEGIGYLSSEPLRFSRKLIMPITPNNPNDPRSPFFDEEGEPMNPIAKLHFTRQRLYEKPCDSDEENPEEDEACATHKWGEWTPCSVPCGLGQRTRLRTYVNPRKAENCYVTLVQHQTCQGTAKYCRTRSSKSHRGRRPKSSDEDENSEQEKKDTEETENSEEKKSSEEEKKSKEEGSKEEEEGSKEEEGSEEEEGSKEEEASEEEEGSKEKEDSKEEEQNSKEKGSEEEEGSKEEKDSKEDGSNEEEKSEEEGKSDEENGSKEQEKEESGSKAEETDKEGCETEDWSEWSSCSASCGYGTKTRDRKLLHPQNKHKCEDVELQENRRCKGEEGKCSEENESKCPNSNWGPWSDCSVTCGKGIKRRLRLPGGDSSDSDENKPDEDESSCTTAEVVECSISCNDNHKIGESLIVEQEPDGRVVNCKTTSWSTWSKCDTHGAACGKGIKKKYRQITRHPENGGKACPKKLIKSKRCNIPCITPKALEEEQSVSTEEEVNRAQCIMSPWSDFTPCSSICGASAMQLRTRKVLYKPPGIACPPRVMYKPCNLPLACTSDGRPIFL